MIIGTLHCNIHVDIYYSHLQQKYCSKNFNEPKRQQTVTKI